MFPRHTHTIEDMETPEVTPDMLTVVSKFPQLKFVEVLDVNLNLRNRIIFYEDRNFQGRHYECSSDSADLSPYFSRCNSIRVESDWWVLYERPNYMGYQYVLSRGEYPDYQCWMGFNDCVKSCRSYPPYRGNTYRMRIYERPNFAGQMMEFVDDCPSVYNRFRYRDIHSCQVMDGYWIFYEHPNYRGRQYFLRPGEYRRYSDWGGYNSMIGSFRRMRDF
ncbi:gamma-crystallin S-1-like [Mobula birostris]|uniref:gamma-crystallin S-1-like n=1 Tax=Mobula birostris TaxID=1983395 RepID=UPI003B288E23